MRVLGLDLAAKADRTGAVFVERTSSGRWRATELEGHLDDDVLVRAADGVDVIGVDSPLGWPVAFVDAVGAHQAFRQWPGGPDRSSLTHRTTDRAVQRLGIRLPLSASADKLGAVAMRCALLQRRWADEVWDVPAPRDGSGVLVEVYPAAAFAAWGIDCRGYKARAPRSEEAALVRRRLVDEIADAVSDWLDLTAVERRCIESDHVLDAVVSALVAIAAKCSATHGPSADHAEVACVEGWIHVPSRPLPELIPPTWQPDPT